MNDARKRPRPRSMHVNDRNLELVKKYKDGDEEALSELILFNYEFIHNMAENKKHLYYPLEVDDIFQDYILGLMESIDHYDLYRESSCSFLSYATFWMHSAADRDATYNQLIRFPVNKYREMKSITKRSGVDDYTYDESDVCELENYSKERARELYFDRYRMYNIVNDKDLNNEIENIGVRYYYDDYMFIKEMRENLKDILSLFLTPREKEVVTLRFGLDDGEPKTISEVAKIFHVTMERIRQIEVKALYKLRRPRASRYFK